MTPREEGAGLHFSVGCANGWSQTTHSGTTFALRRTVMSPPSVAPVRVAVTGAAGQIGYSLLFRIASGEMLGPDQPVALQLLEIPDEKAQKALKGVMMELEDCAFPLLVSQQAYSEANSAFRDIDIALLVGARPRG